VKIAVDLDGNAVEIERERIETVRVEKLPRPGRKRAHRQRIYPPHATVET
jgi:hypothetical protein